MSLPLAVHSWAPAEAAAEGKNAKGRPPSRSAALSIRIPARHKASLRPSLGKGHSAEALFPDPQGFIDHSRFAHEFGGSSSSVAGLPPV
jgi:hypothetical protein